MWGWFRRIFQGGTLTSSPPLLQGSIKRIIRDRGFGFIRTSGGKEVFFHRSALIDVNLGSLSEGQRVEFEVEEGPKGPRASRVRAVDH